MAQLASWSYARFQEKLKSQVGPSVAKTVNIWVWRQCLNLLGYCLMVPEAKYEQFILELLCAKKSPRYWFVWVGLTVMIELISAQTSTELSNRNWACQKGSIRLLSEQHHLSRLSTKHHLEDGGGGICKRRKYEVSSALLSVCVCLSLLIYSVFCILQITNKQNFTTLFHTLHTLHYKSAVLSNVWYFHINEVKTHWQTDT